jgi:hypothetical protein
MFDTTKLRGIYGWLDKQKIILLITKMRCPIVKIYQHTMKFIIIILLGFCTLPVSGQNYPFARDFMNGNIILKDSTVKTGQLKWFPGQDEKLRFRENEKGDIKKYSPEDLIGFNADTLKFVSLFNLELYANEYALLGKTLKIKHTFGQLLDSGKYNIYFVLVTGYDAMSGGNQVYSNYLFEKKTDSSYQYAAYPLGIRMKEKKYEKAKASLYIFFKDYPDIIEKIRSYKQQDDFLEIIRLIKSSN